MISSITISNSSLSDITRKYVILFITRLYYTFLFTILSDNTAYNLMLSNITGEYVINIHY